MNESINSLSIPKLQRLNRWSLGVDEQVHPTFYNGCNYLSMVGLKKNYVSKRGPSSQYMDQLRQLGSRAFVKPT